MRVFALMLLGGFGLSAEEDPAGVLLRLRDYVIAHTAGIPDHTCVETVAREIYEPTGLPVHSCDTLLARRKQPSYPGTLRLATTDRLRLDVLLGTEHELFSWAGAARFEEGEIDELVTNGAFGTGPFAASLLSVLGTRHARFTFEGDTTLDSRRVLEFSFRIPEEISLYRIKAGHQWLVTGYTGTLMVDPASAELVRFTIRTEELPPATGACEHDTSLEFRLVRLEDGDYLLPKSTRQRFIMRDGREAENAIAFSACRDFRGEASLLLTPAAPDGRQFKVGPPVLPLPPGLKVAVEVTSRPIRGDQAAAGDAIAGRLVGTVQGLPAGARFAGRLMRVETHWQKPIEVTIALRWETVEVEGTPVPIALTPDRQAEVALRPRPSPLHRKVEFQLPLPGEERYGVYYFAGNQGTMETGFRTQWFTAR